MATALSFDMARSVFGRVWRGERRKDDFFRQALAVLKIAEADFDRFGLEARRQERGKPRRVVLTPTGSGRRR